MQLHINVKIPPATASRMNIVIIPPILYAV